jgi:hypothetical protein
MCRQQDFIGRAWPGHRALHRTVVGQQHVACASPIRVSCGQGPAAGRRAEALGRSRSNLTRDAVVCSPRATDKLVHVVGGCSGVGVGLVVGATVEAHQLTPGVDGLHLGRHQQAGCAPPSCSTRRERRRRSRSSRRRGRFRGARQCLWGRCRGCWGMCPVLRFGRLLSHSQTGATWAGVTRTAGCGLRRAMPLAPQLQKVLHSARRLDRLRALRQVRLHQALRGGCAARQSAAGRGCWRRGCRQSSRPWVQTRRPAPPATGTGRGCAAARQTRQCRRKGQHLGVEAALRAALVGAGHALQETAGAAVA